MLERTRAISVYRRCLFSYFGSTCLYMGSRKANHGMIRKSGTGFPKAIMRPLGEVPAEGLLFDVASDFFAASRRAISTGCNRSACANMSASARPRTDRRFRERWMVRAQELAKLLGLPYRIDQASDAFFGRGGKLMAMSQIEQALKFELLVPVARPSSRPPA